jgi:hypothetical protein
MEETQPVAVPQAPQQKKRGGLLTFILVLMLIGYGLGALLFLLGGTVLTSLLAALGITGLAGITGSLFFVGLLAMILGFIVTIFVFLWKKWAVYVVLVLAALAVVFSQSGGFSFGGVIVQLILPGLFAYLVWKRWQFFE